mmetsp:Transcript_16348/g.29364  ORF Transcript_16348/g.29364 Transcript_16348/m.29364 type:complete len:209 (+) Transcript_16348:361-987(+)
MREQRRAAEAAAPLQAAGTGVGRRIRFLSLRMPSKRDIYKYSKHRSSKVKVRCSWHSSRSASRYRPANNSSDARSRLFSNVQRREEVLPIPNQAYESRENSMENPYPDPVTAPHLTNPEAAVSLTTTLELEVPPPRCIPPPSRLPRHQTSPAPCIGRGGFPCHHSARTHKLQRPHTASSSLRLYMNSLPLLVSRCEEGIITIASDHSA